ncbi:MAG TPA: hypothetical protein VKB95_07340 [Chitinophagaceae bacterium]|nr:hypothetical protein [Chitinophagaceae bacterium]
MRTKLICIISLTILFFESCEGVKTLTGTVISEKTGTPISHAEIVVKKSRKELIKTDTSGNFLINSRFTSMMFGGPRFVFEIRKDGYSSRSIKKRNGHITIQLSEKK